MSEYVKECIFCKAKIRMSDKEGKWLPFNEDGSQHDCKKEKNGTSTYTLDAVVKKLASIGVKVDLEALMK